MSRDGANTTRRAYRPAIEALETLRLLSSAPVVPVDLIAQHGPISDSVATSPSAPVDLATWGDATWDAALDDGVESDWYSPESQGQGGLAIREAESTPDPDDVSQGLDQLQRYFSRAWFRAGISPQKHDDCSQAVFTTLLQNLGRSRFDRLAAEIGESGIKDVLSRETAEGPDFFRAIDTVKKRAQRERIYQAIDNVDIAAPSDSADPSGGWRTVLQEAISQTLNPRETALIQATLQGETPAEIAQKWGVAPKTVSNEKTRVFQKLRDVLVADLLD